VAAETGSRRKLANKKGGFQRLNSSPNKTNRETIITETSNKMHFLD